MITWALRLAMTGPSEQIRTEFEAIIDHYHALEKANPELLDCSWSLTHTPNSVHADIEGEITVRSAEPDESYLIAASAVRSAIHASGGYTPDWTSTPPRDSPVVIALNSAHELVGG